VWTYTNTGRRKRRSGGSAIVVSTQPGMPYSSNMLCATDEKDRLWPYHATQQKVARSWSTQVDLMERYPEHRFASSSAQQYKWLEQLYPPLLREMGRAGKFCPIGGSWVENDANMPSGEALARQLIFGQRYFESRFGMRSRVEWLPDSFGLTGALPQTIRGAGMDYFFTLFVSIRHLQKKKREEGRNKAIHAEISFAKLYAPREDEKPMATSVDGPPGLDGDPIPNVFSPQP
jgi:Glycosyl hydrolases family 38 N-terminal domain